MCSISTKHRVTMWLVRPADGGVTRIRRLPEAAAKGSIILVMHPSKVLTTHVMTMSDKEETSTGP